MFSSILKQRSVAQHPNAGQNTQQLSFQLYRQIFLFYRNIPSARYFALFRALSVGAFSYSIVPLDVPALKTTEERETGATVHAQEKREREMGVTAQVREERERETITKLRKNKNVPSLDRLFEVTVFNL